MSFFGADACHFVNNMYRWRSVCLCQFKDAYPASLEFLRGFSIFCSRARFSDAECLTRVLTRMKPGSQWKNV